jgi:hypothetical protein
MAPTTASNRKNEKEAVSNGARCNTIDDDDTLQSKHNQVIKSSNGSKTYPVVLRDSPKEKSHPHSNC